MIHSRTSFAILVALTGIFAAVGRADEVAVTDQEFKRLESEAYKLPKVQSALETLLGKTLFADYTSNMDSISSGDIDDGKDKVVIEGWVQGLVVTNHGILELTASGKIWGAFSSVEGTFYYYFTNQEGGSAKIPVVIQKWAKKRSQKNAVFKNITKGIDSKRVENSKFKVYSTDISKIHPEHPCRIDDGEFKTAKLVTITAAKTHFLTEPKACPAVRPCEWKRSGFLVSGNEVATGKVANGFTCVAYFAKGNVFFTGWIPQKDLSSVAPPTAVPIASDWLGKWTSGPSAEFRISSKSTDKKLEIHGLAAFGANSREIDGFGVISVSEVRFQETPENCDTPNKCCKYRLRLLGPFLVVDQAQNCENADYDFQGIYGRRKK